MLGFLIVDRMKDILGDNDEYIAIYEACSYILYPVICKGESQQINRIRWISLRNGLVRLCTGLE
jgi:hypothetical protein